MQLKLVNVKSSFLSAFVIFVVQSACQGQDIVWDKTSNWRLYNLRSAKTFKIPIDSLQLLASLELSRDTMSFFSKEFAIWPVSQTAVWMGQYVVTFEDSIGSVRKLVISNYGGFLYDPSQKRYYVLPPKLREQWYDWLNQKSRILIAGSND